MASTTLSPQQLHALFDVLVHYQTYNEIQRFKQPTATQNYGPPFHLSDESVSSSPLLQTLVQRFVLQLPGLRDLTPDFWDKRCQPLIEKLAVAELSESYDKGTIGSRRTLATAFATLLEYPARGVLGGLPDKSDSKDVQDEYDISEADDILAAWDQFAQQLIHGNMIEHLFDTIEKTDKLEEQSSLVQAAHEYLVINLASFLHYIMVLSPDGPYLARLMENINKLVPYGLIRQTLRIGNAATMINGMLRLLLTKLSVNSITSWMGLSKPSDDGMNLLQQIASTVITWDVAELQRQSATIEKDKEAPSKQYFDAIKAHLRETREEREERRLRSEKESKSIVAVIFDKSDLSLDLSEPQHSQALDYLTIQLSIRDREQLSKIICEGKPDLITQSVRDVMAAYDPILRKVHSTVDLSTGLTDFENFMADLVKLSKGVSATACRPGSERESASIENGPNGQPTVADFIKLLKKHQSASHRFVHQVAKNCDSVFLQYKNYTHTAVANFQPQRNDAEKVNGEHGQSSQPHYNAGTMTPKLQKLFSELPEESQKLVSDALDNQAAYLFALYCTSRDRMRAAIEDDRTAPTGPGLYLPKWQQLLDSTTITPATANGPVRTGKDSSVKEKGGVGIEITSEEKDGPLDGGDIPDPPDVGRIVELLGPKFQKMLADIGRRQWASQKNNQDPE